MTSRTNLDRPIKGQRPDTRTPGYTYLPGGPAFQDPGNMVKYLRKNPGYAWKHRAWLQAQAPREFGLAGYSVAKNGQMLQYEGSADSGPARGKVKRAWVHDKADAATLAKSADKPKVVAVKAATAVAAKTKPGTKPAAVSTPGARDTRTVSDVAAEQAAAADGSVDFSGLFGSLNSDTGIPLSEAMAKGGAQPFGPKVAEQLAGLQYDGQINQVGIDQARAPKVTAQNLKDIGSWYGQVLGSQKTAAGRDAAINKAAVGSVGDASKSILSAIGGQASEGAGLVGAAGVQAVGTLGALGTAQEQFNADLRPLLESEKAGAATREQAAGTTRAQDLANRLAALQGERGAAQAGFQFEVGKANNDIRDSQANRALQIRQANNQLAQQGFQNQIAAVNAQLGAQISGLEIAGKTQELLNPQGPETSYPFAKAPVSQKTEAYRQGMATILDAEGQKLKVPVPRAVQLVNQLLAGYGWSRKNPAVKQLRDQILSDAGIRPDPRWR